MPVPESIVLIDHSGGVPSVNKDWTKAAQVCLVGQEDRRPDVKQTGKPLHKGVAS